MKIPTSVAELHNKLGAPSSETVESLRLLTAFLKLAPRRRFEVIALVQRLATDSGIRPLVLTAVTARLTMSHVSARLEMQNLLGAILLGELRSSAATIGHNRVMGPI